MPEEKKDEAAVTPEVASEKPAPAEEESDFADESKPLPPVEEPKPAEVKEEVRPAVELHDEKEETPAPETPVKPANKASVVYSYGDPLLQQIEEARKSFYVAYKKANLWKWIVTGLALVLILAGWLIPTFVPALASNSTTSMYITLGVLAFAVIILGVYSYFYKKKLDVAMKQYFAQYYELTNKFVFGDRISELSGGVDDKLDPAIFNAAGLYKDVVKVGSRETLHFTYKDQKLTLADCAGQVKGQKSLQTVFVGKMLVAPNTWTGADAVIYLKGNKRALPPTTLDQFGVVEDSKTMVVYSKGTDGKKLLSKPVREALAKIRTNNTLVDVAVSVKAGNTYFALGYEDDLMVLPLDKPFNPNPTDEYKADMILVFNLLDALAAPHQD